MKILSSFLILFFVACSSSTKTAVVAQDASQDSGRTIAEATSGFMGGNYDDEEVIGANAPRTCLLRVTGNYSVRSGASTRNRRCGLRVIRPLDAQRQTNGVVVLGLTGNWVKISSPETRSCPGGYGYSHYKAFNKKDLARFRNGECGQASMDTRRRPAPVPPPTKSVRPTGGSQYSFIMDRCYGLKNDGGAGHYGARRRSHGRKYAHTGTDYYAPKGTVLRSPCSGVVEKSFVGARSGNSVYIRCSNGTRFKYMHMHSYPRKATRGARVAAGTVIGGVGNSGNARRQAPHVHLEVMVGGRRINPQSLWSCGGDSGH